MTTPVMAASSSVHLGLLCTNGRQVAVIVYFEPQLHCDAANTDILSIVVIG